MKQGLHLKSQRKQPQATKTVIRNSSQKLYYLKKLLQNLHVGEFFSKNSKGVQFWTAVPYFTKVKINFFDIYIQEFQAKFHLGTLQNS